MSIALIGGIDPTGGAGLLRDLWAIEAFAGHRRRELPSHTVTVPSAWTWQGGVGQAARAQALDSVAFDRVLSRAIAPRVIKIGLVPAELVGPLLRWLATQREREPKLQVVLDPVLRASDGGALGASVDGLWSVIEAADLVTPNRAEAEALLGSGAADAGSALGARLSQRSGAATSWLIKSVFANPQEFHDELWGPTGMRATLRQPRVELPDPRGTGCALASAIACGMWHGLDPLAAVREASDWLVKARAHTRMSAFGQPHLSASPSSA